MHTWFNQVDWQVGAQRINYPLYKLAVPKQIIHKKIHNIFTKYIRKKR